MNLIPVLPQDKANHFVYGAVIAAVLNPVVGAPIAACAVILIGLGKEVYDKLSSKGTYDVLDAVATAFGGGTVLASCNWS